MEKLPSISKQNQPKHNAMKEQLIKYVEQLEIERQEKADVYSEETLIRLGNLIKEYHKLILSL